MWMNGFTDIHRIGPHLNGERDFSNQIAGVRTNNATSQNFVGCCIKQQLGKAFVTAVRNRPTRRSPGEQTFRDLNTLLNSLLFCQTYPSNLWIRIRNRRDHTGVKKAFLTCRNLSCDMTFVYGFVCEHRLPDDISDCKDMWNICSHLAIDVNKTAFTDQYTGLFSGNFFAIRRTSNCLKNKVIALRLSRCIRTFKLNVNPIFFGFSRNRARPKL
jgi:hypothetical protein